MQNSNNKHFTHFKVHTQYSICEGAVKIESLKDFCKENKLVSVGICDTENLCGALEFSEKLSKVSEKFTTLLLIDKLPLVGLSIIDKILSKVDFPEPDGPTKE